MVMEGVMDHEGTKESAKLTTFGRRKVTPRVCIADSKQHIRTFLEEALEELGFITCECTQVSTLGALIDAQLPDLLVLGLSGGGIAAGEMLKVLANKEFQSKV
jgi:DNA-binding response OmpR family regulator